MSETAPMDESDRRTELGHLRDNLPFLTRALRAYIRSENAVFFGDFQSEQGEIAVLSVIGLNPGISQNEVAAALVLKKSAVTKLIKGLEDRQLVERRKGETDKRFNALTLTPDGQVKYERITLRMAEQHAALLEPLSDQERLELFDYLNRLHAHLVSRQTQRTGSGQTADDKADD